VIRNFDGASATGDLVGLPVGRASVETGQELPRTSKRLPIQTRRRRPWQQRRVGWQATTAPWVARWRDPLRSGRCRGLRAQQRLASHIAHGRSGEPCRDSRRSDVAVVLHSGVASMIVCYGDQSWPVAKPVLRGSTLATPLWGCPHRSLRGWRRGNGVGSQYDLNSGANRRLDRPLCSRGSQGRRHVLQ
jgi:hypothetical protein